MRFRIGDVELEADVEDEGIETSKHTGKDLSNLILRFSCQGKEYNEHVLKIFEQAQKEGLTSTTPAGDLDKWKAKNNSWSYTDQGRRTIYHHTWHIQEKEDLTISKLIIDSIELEPYRYEETFDGDALIIHARIRQTEKDVEAFRDHFSDKEYFSVIRKGINEEPKEMRFGRRLWSKEDNIIKQEIVLVDRSNDKTGFKGFLEPQFNNVQTALALIDATVEELLSLLSSKGILTSEEIAILTLKTTERANDSYRNFYRVEDLDKWLGTED